tara:strand:- start:224 stop:373 length:150 start_codon:yes stop_codon:yes gene_type:complete
MFSSFLGCLCKIRFLILGTSIEYAELDDIKYIKIINNLINNDFIEKYLS